MNHLCLLTGLTSSEWAAWVQAIGSIAAILGAVGVAIWQSRQQHRTSLATLKVERSLARIEAARALQELSTGALRLLEQSTEAFPDRQAVYDTAVGRRYFDFGELRVIEGAVQAIPLHTLPHDLVRLTLIVGSCVRQFRENIEFAISHHRNMDSNAFGTLFGGLSSLTRNLELTCEDIDAAVKRAQSEA
jgi:hypothetical protein